MTQPIEKVQKDYMHGQVNAADTDTMSDAFINTAETLKLLKMIGSIDWYPKVAVIDIVFIDDMMQKGELYGTNLVVSERQLVRLRAVREKLAAAGALSL